MQIMAVYCVGSRAMAHEARSLSVPSLRWLGVLPSDLARYHVPAGARLPLTAADARKARELLARDFVRAHPAWQRELTLLLELGVKAEVEGLQDAAHGLRYLTDHYLATKLRTGGWV
jgi:meiotic recombination protein SPO11